MSEEKYEVNVRPEKVTVVEEMKEKLGYQGVVLVTFNRLDVKNATLLRRKFLAHGVEYKVIKNTLTRIAANDLGITGLDDLLQEQVGLVDLAAGAERPVGAHAFRLHAAAHVLDGGVGVAARGGQAP